ncbi:MAG: type II toxin-antitoxin system VapC family toxin [Candidatus Omnitrophica bacterium]|nr:type II toxin-antitoxin system VapC family toxin [Candidatus Omnitrophota bacterium]
MKKRVYIETSIPSFYFEVRTEPEMIARRNWTREWWDEHAHNYELVTSDPVFDELERGVYPNQKQALKLIDGLTVLLVDKEVIEIAKVYIANKTMPRDPTGDALHLAIATHYKCDFLLTWNCNHLANANKFGHIERVNAMLGLATPRLVTPLELLGGNDNERR